MFFFQTTSITWRVGMTSKVCYRTCMYGHSNACQYMKYLIAHSPIFMIIKDILFIKEEILNLR